MSVELPERDGDCYLVSMDDWTTEIGRAMAEADGFELDDEKWEQIMQAREYYEQENVVPAIRIFAKRALSPSDVAINTVPSSPISMVAPVSS